VDGILLHQRRATGLTKPLENGKNHWVNCRRVWT